MNNKHKEKKNLQMTMWRDESLSEDEFIYASGSIGGLEGRSMEKPLVNLSY